jgi:mRNA interferase MazF
MTKGTIVLTPFPFTDLTATKKRPAIIVSAETEADDIIVAFISSRVRETMPPTDYLFDTDAREFPASGLKVRSVIKLSKLVILEKKILLGELGRVGEKTLGEVDKRLRITFGI